MEEVYILIQDCVHDLSSQFTFNQLLQLSTASKHHSQSIYELKIHNHNNQSIYYSSTNQIKRFHNIHTLMIPKYYQYNNLNQLTNIHHITFCNMRLIDTITKLTHLTSCNLIDDDVLSSRKFFHTNLRNLYDLSCNFEDMSYIEYLTSFSHVTYINMYNSRDNPDVEILLPFVHLKSLDAFPLNNMSKLSLLKSLSEISIHNYRRLNTHIGIDHSMLTKVEIITIDTIVFQNCSNLVHLELINFKTCKMENIDLLCLRTLILSPSDDIISDFDLNRCFNLEYLHCTCEIKNISRLSSDLIKLNQLHLMHLADVNVDCVVANNLIDLSFFFDGRKSTDVFDFIHCSNLKKLSIKNISCINIDKLIQLEHLNLHDSSIEIDCGDYSNLTHLKLARNKFRNLSVLTKLNRLELFMWNNDISHLFELTYLNIFDCYKNKSFDGNILSNCTRLKYFHCNIPLNNLDLSFDSFPMIWNLQIPYHESYVVTRLSKLTNLFFSDYNAESRVNLKGLNRLIRHNRKTKKVILPEMRWIS